MIAYNRGSVLNSEQPVIVYKSDCFATDSPAELVSRFPDVYALFKQFVKSKVLIPGEIIPVLSGERTIIIAVTKFTARFTEEPEDVRDVIENIASHCDIRERSGVAFSGFGDLEPYSDLLTGLSVESWDSASSASMTSAS